MAEGPVGPEGRAGRGGAARSFGSVADAYERGRPDYPLEAAEWLVGSGASGAPLRVLELGAGTGKLTRRLLALGHEVLATDPDAAMLEVLARELPDADTMVAGAEDLEVDDQSYDVVVAAQCLHWFDLERALPEIARVLRPGGRLAAVWNERDQRVPWVKRLGSLIGTQDQLRDPTDDLLASELFRDVEAAEFKHRQHLDQHTVRDLVLSRSNVATLAPEEREPVLAAVSALYDDYGRGMDGMLLPYFARCFRADVVEIVLPPRVEPAQGGDTADEAGEAGPDDLPDPMTDTIPRGLRGQVRPARATDLPRTLGTTGTDVVDLDDTQMILIDFR